MPLFLNVYAELVFLVNATRGTMFEIYSFDFWHFWHFPPIFIILLKVTCMVTSSFQKSRQSEPFLAFLRNFCQTQNVNVARFARNLECDILDDFQTLCRGTVHCSAFL